MTKRFRLAVAALTCFAVVAGVIFYVRAQSQGTELPVKDPQAVAILNRAAEAMGANFLQNAADTVATGTLTIYQPDGQTSSGTITLLTRGASQLRTEIDEGGSLRSVTVSNGEAWLERNGQVIDFSSETAREIRPEHLPQLSKIRAAGLGAVGVRFVGTEPLEGSATPVYVIDLQDTSPGEHSEMSSEASLGVRLPGNFYRFYIDSATYLIRKVAFTRGAEGNPTARSVVEDAFSDYRPFGPMMIPFQSERRSGGEVINSIKLTSFQYNTGLGSDKFAKPASVAQGGAR